MVHSARIPVLLGIMTGLLLTLVAWGLLTRSRHDTAGAVAATENDVLVGLLVLAALALGAFLTFALVNP